MNKFYDIIIAGGGTSGCAAAYTAGKAGLKTLLVEKNIHLGGAMTSSLVIPCMNPGENQINTDFYNALIIELKKLGGQVTYQGNNGWFNPELTKIALDNLMNCANVDVLFNTKIDSLNVINNRIINVKILSEPIETRYVIDSTGNCDVGFLSNCEFLNKNEEIQSLEGHKSYVISVIKIKNGDLVSCSNDHTIKIWRNK